MTVGRIERSEREGTYASDARANQNNRKNISSGNLSAALTDAERRRKGLKSVTNGGNETKATIGRKKTTQKSGLKGALSRDVSCMIT